MFFKTRKRRDGRFPANGNGREIDAVLIKVVVHKVNHKGVAII
jgi:hypothetical protein